MEMCNKEPVTLCCSFVFGVLSSIDSAVNCLISCFGRGRPAF